jgi:DNA-binding LacI/PurR family transcriptional regulator
VIQDTSLAGELLVETLLKLVREETVDSVMMPPSLVVRRSSTVG